MKVSYNWLKDYVDFDLSPQALAEKLTMSGLEVEEIISTLPKFKGVIVGKVLEVEKHPNADQLSICQVDTGSEQLKVICGAPNVAKDQMVPFAPVGTMLPNGIKIKKAKIRGVESFGMICSEEELGLSEKSDGIWELPANFDLGADLYIQLHAAQDYVFDVSITPNRPDAMSMIGIAREVAAILNTEYRKPVISKVEVSDRAADIIQIEVHSKDGCPRYAARVIKDVKIGPSPKWMADRLTAGGIRPINTIVDITNYVLLELGQPLHAFDLSKLSGSRIVVRYSAKNEKFTTLDEKDRIMPPETVMICDAEQAVAIGGIMGGLNSEVSEQTVDVLLESAYFNPIRIGASSKKLGLSSEASQRFERGIDPNGIPFACDRAAFLMAELAGGKVLRDIVDEYPAKINEKIVAVRTKRVNMLLGTELTELEIKHIFSRLGISYQKGKAVIPTFRPDLEREVDLIEEVARLITYERIPLKKQTRIDYDTAVNQDENFYRLLKSQIRELGFNEVYTNSMVALREMENLEKDNFVRIMNPISDDMNVMRRSLLPGLLKVAAFNINRNRPDLRLFEIGRVFFNQIPEAVNSQPYYLSGIIHGSRKIQSWDEHALRVDFYDIKGLVEAFLVKIFLDNIELILYDNTVCFDQSQAATVKIDGDTIGHFGRIKTEVIHLYDIDSDVYGFEFSVDVLRTQVNLNRLFQKFSKFPFIEKDLALVVENDVNAGELKDLIFHSGKPLVNQIDVFDLFRGKQLGEAKKSIAFRIRFQSSERTLNEKEVSKIFDRIIKDAERNFNAKLRDSE